MMDAKTIFATASLMVLANGAILAVIYGDLPTGLRCAARHWCLGTLLIAAGCIAFAFGGALPRVAMLVLANAAFAFGLTAYLAAIRAFHGLPFGWGHLLPAAVATACVAWFSTVTPDFQVRMAVVSAVWLWLMGACVWTLLAWPAGQRSLSRIVLAGMFLLFGACAAARAVLYVTSDLSRDFAIETGGHWLNVLSVILLILLPVSGTTTFLLMCSDRLRRGVEEAAATDHLTGLPNRRSLACHGAVVLERARRGGERFSAAIFDIDEFKRINDRYGHEAGDRALVHVAAILRAETRATDMIARTGGEEFVVLFCGLDRAAAFTAAERMRRAVEAARFALGPDGIAITVSGGVSACRPGDRSYEDTLGRADKALYRAKSAGRNRIEIEADDPAPERDRSAPPVRHVLSEPPGLYPDIPEMLTPARR